MPKSYCLKFMFAGMVCNSNEIETIFNSTKEALEWGLSMPGVTMIAVMDSDTKGDSYYEIIVTDREKDELIKGFAQNKVFGGSDIRA